MIKTAKFKFLSLDALIFPAKALAVALIGFLAFFTVVAHCAAEPWQAKASIDVNGTGLTQAILPAELLMGNDNGSYDLVLNGPDKNPRAFELFMKNKSGSRQFILKPANIRLNQEGGFVWDADLPETIVNEIRIEMGDHNYLGRVDVAVQTDAGWETIAKNQAIYRTTGATNASIEITQGIYKKIRLIFTGFDKANKQKIVPIRRVTALHRGKDEKYADIQIVMTDHLQISKADDVTELKMILPGKGIRIKQIRIITKRPFQGTWELGREQIRNNRVEFIPEQSGRVSGVAGDGRLITMEINRVWNTNGLMLRLRSDSGFLGPIEQAVVVSQQPKILFSADMPGRYTALAGTGRHTKLKQLADISGRAQVRHLDFSSPEVKIWYNSQSLLEKFKIKGGPFDENDGYRWKSPVTLDKIGYYRLIFNLETSLDKAGQYVRLVKDNKQIPFFWGRQTYRCHELAAQTEYNREENTTSWEVSLPVTSEAWQTLVLTGSGIFSRTVRCYREKSGRSGWEKVMTRNWSHAEQGAAQLEIDSPGRFMNARRFKISIDHGDNQPIEISKIEAGFMAPSICFLAYEPGNYFLFGGNEAAGRPSYDLTLIQDRLMASLPENIEMAAADVVKASKWDQLLERLFQGKGIGLYAVLGVVTLVLIGIIVRLFPKAGFRGPQN
ncbi:hypothetical protein DO021_00875 [Desulfobacter hydrogenophilus]|uniref:DUF3999 domain-containing protein n=1 Tax=Desulfobacter hydrogenophilus TaxID=2291 RepID=A0A328FLT9_9BACT|nr:hypothetical protein [Desulfobacter hydrogenophilus]NDY72796.1 hypothetical protein [Desulfobacter hydrogenophilus]QBH13023.1 hypothetical protein EYB58_08890 [Desulfobacter hydrogenophilus]RAM04007.1 hypothetical protein DO021_00875 [Desulfobacter hydrogenophilus]